MFVCLELLSLVLFQGLALTNLGGTYDALGRYKDALAMREQALDFNRRFLPENHPDIGAGNFPLRVDLTF